MVVSIVGGAAPVRESGSLVAARACSSTATSLLLAGPSLASPGELTRGDVGAAALIERNVVDWFAGASLGSSLVEADADGVASPRTVSPTAGSLVAEVSTSAAAD